MAPNLVNLSYVLRQTYRVLKMPSLISPMGWMKLQEWRFCLNIIAYTLVTIIFFSESEYFYVSQHMCSNIICIVI